MKKWLLLFVLSWRTFFLYAQHSNGVAADARAPEQKIAGYLRTYDLHSVSSSNFDVTWYRCHWIVDPAVRFIAGSITSAFTITASTASIVFDLNNALTVDSVLYHGSKTTFLQIPGNGLQVNFPATLSVGQKDAVSIYYKGVPPAGGAFVTSTHAGVPVLWTLSEPYGASLWWPCKDVLTDKADSIDIAITYPIAYTASSNGLPVGETINGATKTTFWKHRYPVASYLVAIAVTNYSVTMDAASLPSRLMPVVTYAYPEAAASFTPANGIATFCLERFSQLLTEYPFAQERYAQTQFGFGGGMEHQTNSFLFNSSPGLVAHELAHQWFGDKVTCGSWTDLWLNEGFASYMEYIYTELTNPGGRLPFLQGWRNSITSQPGGSVYVTDTLNEARLFDARLTYRKGGYLLHMLRWKLGDSTFFRGLRRYLNDPLLAYRAARTTDLQRILEAESGQTLGAFFQAWYYGEGYPNYTAVWSQQANGKAQVRLTQAPSHQSVSFYEMPVPLQFKSATRDTIIVVNHHYSGQVFTVSPGFTADTLIIDPLLWILAKDKATQKVSEPLNNDLLIYPNPNSGTFSIVLPVTVTGNTAVRLYNAAGQLVYSSVIPASAASTEIRTGHLASGIYMLHLSDGNTMDVKQKILVSRK